MAELQAQNRDLERNLDGMTKRNAECNHQLESLTESNQSIIDMKDLEIETLRESKDNLETRIAAIEARTQKALNNARTNKNTSLTEATTQLQAQFEAAQTQFTAEKQALENRLTNLTDQLAIATTKASEKEADSQTLRDEKARITGLLGNSDDLVTAIRSLQQELDELRNQKATDDNKLFELTEAVNQKERTLAEQTSRLTSLESERNSLRQRLTEEQEGFNMRMSKTKEAANSKEADAIAELEERLRIAEDFRDGLQTDLDATRDQLAALQGELVAAQSLAASKQAELDAFATLLPPAGNVTQDLLARLRTLQQDLEAAKAARRESDTQFAEHASQVAELDRLIYKDAAKSATPRTLAELISRTRTFLQNCDETNLEKAEIVKRLKVLQSKSDASEAELAGLRASLAAAQQNAASLTSQLDAIRASTAKNVETARSTATSAQQQVIDDLALQLNAANEAIDELRSHCDDNLAEQEATITQLTAEGERHKESTNKLITELHDITKRVKELQENHRKELEDIHTFYGGAVTGLSNYSEGMRQQGVRNATNAFLLNPGGGPSRPSPYTASDFAGIRPASSSSSASAPSSESWVVKPHQAQAYPAGSRPIDGTYSLSRVTQTGPKNASGVAGPTGVVNPTLTAESKALARPPFVTGKPHLNLPEPSTASSKQQTTINSPGRASMVPKKTGSRRKQKVSRKTRKNRK
jgi:chromosome segregation ATPase